MKHRYRWAALGFVVIFGGAMAAGFMNMGVPSEAPLRDGVLAQGIAQTGARNLVAAIYLHYRLFDTLLEALLLLVSVIGVSQFSHLSGAERAYPDVNRTQRRLHPSEVVTGSLGPVYLLIAVFGAYVILTGMDGPGGGFQGGAVLAAIVIGAHFAQGRQLIASHTAERLEKIFYVLILACGMTFLIWGDAWKIWQHRLYLTVFNVLIGTKVFAGLSVIYLRFMRSGADFTNHGIEQGEELDHGQ